MSVKTKILIIRFSSIGDIVLTTPIVRCLKEQLDGESEIHFLVKESFVPVLEHNPYIDVIHSLSGDLKTTAAEIEKEGFHYIIDLHKNIRSIFVKNKLSGLKFTFRKLNVQKWILVNLGIDFLPDIHLVDRYFEAVKPLGIENDNKGLDYFLPESDEVDVHQKFGLESGKYIAFAIGGAHEGKKLPPSKLVELCALINKPIILLGGAEDVEVGKDIANANSHVVNACGETSLNESASILKQSAFVISHDSGMMHIASAFRKKIISIWGATVPKFGMYPYIPHPDSVMIQADHLKFRPTSKLGNKNSKKEQRTTEEIDLGRIVEAVDRMWNK